MAGDRYAKRRNIHRLVEEKYKREREGKERKIDDRKDDDGSNTCRQPGKLGNMIIVRRTATGLSVVDSCPNFRWQWE